MYYQHCSFDTMAESISDETTYTLVCTTTFIITTKTKNGEIIEKEYEKTETKNVTDPKEITQFSTGAYTQTNKYGQNSSTIIRYDENGTMIGRPSRWRNGSMLK